MHVAEVLDREGGVAVVLGSARRQHARAEPAGSFDQVGFVAGKAERGRVEYRRIGVALVGIAGIHGRNRASLRKSSTAASKAAGASRLGRWPTLGRHT